MGMALAWGPLTLQDCCQGLDSLAICAHCLSTPEASPTPERFPDYASTVGWIRSAFAKRTGVSTSFLDLFADIVQMLPTLTYEEHHWTEHQKHRLVQVLVEEVSEVLANHRRLTIEQNGALTRIVGVAADFLRMEGGCVSLQTTLSFLPHHPGLFRKLTPATWRAEILPKAMKRGFETLFPSRRRPWDEFVDSQAWELLQACPWWERAEFRDFVLRSLHRQRRRDLVARLFTQDEVQNAGLSPARQKRMAVQNENDRRVVTRSRAIENAPKRIRLVGNVSL